MFESDEKVEIAHLIDDLNDLVQLHHDQLASLREAVPKVGNAAMRAALEKFINDHSLHIAQLSRLIRRYGGDAAQRGDYRQFGTRMRVAAGGFFSDSGLHAAIRANEHKLVLEYERCLRSLRAAPQLEPLLEDHFHAGKCRLHDLESLRDKASAEYS